jgi:Na+/melibiose symporter-like transporter
VTYLGLALYLVNGLPFMMDATGLEERNHAFSVHMALAPLAAFAGSLMAGVLPGAFARLLGVPLDAAAPFRFPLWLAALILVPGVATLLVSRPVEGHQPPLAVAPARASTASRAPYGLFVAIGVIMALRFGGRGGIATFFNVYMDQGLGVQPSLIGALSAVGQLLSVPAALAAPLLVARWGNVRTVFWGTMVMALCTLPLALVPQWGAAGVGFVSSTIFFAMTTGPIRVFSQELVAPRWRASMASAFMMGAGLAFAAASLVGGYAIVAWGYNIVFLVGAGTVAVGGVMFWSLFRVARGELARQPLPEGRE